MYVIGIDPAASTGFFAYKPVDRFIAMTELLQAPKSYDYDRQIKWISDATADCFSQFKPEEILAVCIESSHMAQNINVNDKWQAMRGGIIARFPDAVDIRHVGATKVKRLVAGSGDADKEQVAWAVQKFFAEYSKEGEGCIRGLVSKKQWDLTDAAAIALAGWEFK